MASFRLPDRVGHLMRSTVALVASLSLSTIGSADAKIDFEAAIARWRSQAITAYSFTYQDQDGGVISAFCVGALIRVSVDSGKSVRTRVIQGTRRCPTGTRGKAIDVEVPSRLTHFRPNPSLGLRPAGEGGPRNYL